MTELMSLVNDTVRQFAVDVKHRIYRTPYVAHWKQFCTFKLSFALVSAARPAVHIPPDDHGIFAVWPPSDMICGTEYGYGGDFESGGNVHGA